MNLSSASSAATTPPSIGQRWPGIDGIYAGIAKGEDGAPDHHLVLLDTRPAPMSWKDAMAAAVAMGADLPTRNESALLYAHLREEFDATRWHWTSTQYSADDAWLQLFDDGYQDAYDKKFEALWRPVRRLILQSFTPSVELTAEPDESITVLRDILTEIQGAREDTKSIAAATVTA